MSEVVAKDRDAELLALLRRRNTLMHSAESVEHGRRMRTRPSDVFIVTYPKCGTTWVSAIAHALRGGSFEGLGEITQVVPWDVVARDCGQDLNADQSWAPRLFKSHEPRATIAPGARYIYVARDPRDAFVSFYNFLPAYMHCQGLSVGAFAEGIFGGLSHSGGIWDHLVAWWGHRGDPNVLWVTFEDLKANPKREIRRIAAFMGLDEEDEAHLDRVRAATSLQAMAAIGAAFDDHFVFDRLKRQMRLPPDAMHGTSKVQSGTVGHALEPHIAAMLQRRWEATVRPATGLADYAAMRAALHQTDNNAPTTGSVDG